MRRKIGLVATILLLTLSALLTLGATPRQEGGGVAPPQPFYADYFSGRVILQSFTAPPGLRLVACVDACEAYESEAFVLGPGGTFHLMPVEPENRRLRGRDITFYIVNEYGRVKAAETRVYEGAYSITSLDLHFNDPLPLPPVAPTLPQVGDPFIPFLPKVFLALGSAAVVAGVFLLIQMRRRRVAGTFQ